MTKNIKIHNVDCDSCPLQYPKNIFLSHTLEWNYSQRETVILQRLWILP